MNQLRVSVTKILGACTSTPPMEKGDYFTVENGDLRLPGGRSFCLWALQSVLPLLPAKERRIGERRAEDWMWRVHHVQCPDPAGRVVLKIDKIPGPVGGLRASAAEGPPSSAKESAPAPGAARPGASSPIRPLRFVVEEVRGKCTSGLKKGDYFRLDGGRLSLPPGGHFCLYALQAVLPFVAAKQRRLEDGDWLKDEDRFICPDPAGNVVLRIERL